MLSPLLILVLILFLGSLFLLVLKRSLQRSLAAVPARKGCELELGTCYERKGTLLSPCEQRFYRALRLALPENHDVSCKVRLEDLVQLQSGVQSEKRRGLRNRIKSRHIDFVVTRQSDSGIVSLIELDDSSHRSKRIQESDAFKNNLAEATGLKLHRFKASSGYHVHDIRNCLYGRN